MIKKERKNLLELIKLDFNHMIFGSIILNILFLLFGVIIYMNPFITASTVGIIIGIYFILFGIYYIYEFFMRKSISIFGYKIILGILSIILGIFVILNPFNIIKILTFTLGIYLIITSLYKGVSSFKLKKLGYDGWLIMLVTSILLLIFGLITAINPIVSLDIIKVCGIFIILASILEICNLFMVFKKAKDFVKLFKKN